MTRKQARQCTRVRARPRAKARKRAREGVHFNRGEDATVSVEGETILGIGVETVDVDAI